MAWQPSPNGIFSISPKIDLLFCFKNGTYFWDYELKCYSVCCGDSSKHLCVEISGENLISVSKLTISYNDVAKIGNIHRLKKWCIQRFYSKWPIVPVNSTLELLKTARITSTARTKRTGSGKGSFM